MMFRTLPVFGSDPRTTAEIVNGIMNGKTNNTGLITLNTGNATTTTINNERISRDSLIILVPVSDAAEADSLPYGEFICTTGQTAAAVNTAYALGMNTTVRANGMALVSTTNITVKTAGLYKFDFSVQLENKDNEHRDVSIWFQKNGTNIDYSNRIVSVPARKGSTGYGRVIANLGVFQDMAVDDYIRIMWSTESTQVEIKAVGTQTSPNRPETPCKIALVEFVSAAASSNVYVSAQTNGSATVTHFANSTANKTYGYVVVG